MTINLYVNSSANNVADKSLSLLHGTDAHPLSLDAVTPVVVVDGSFPTCNYVEIPSFGRFYYAKATVLQNHTTRLECRSDALGTIGKNGGIYGTSQYVSRCETGFNLMIPDNMLPIEVKNIPKVQRGTVEFGTSSEKIILGCTKYFFKPTFARIIEDITGKDENA